MLWIMCTLILCLGTHRTLTRAQLFLRCLPSMEDLIQIFFSVGLITMGTLYGQKRLEDILKTFPCQWCLMTKEVFIVQAYMVELLISTLGQAYIMFRVHCLPKC